MKNILKITSLSVLAFSLAACTQSYKNQTILTSMPEVNNIKTLAGMRQVAFEWDPIYDANVIGYKIYRTKMGDEASKEVLVATLEDRYKTHFSDEKLEPNTKYLYTFTTFNKEGVSASSSVNVTTLPKITPVPFVQAITGLPNKIKIIWRPHPDGRVVKYNIYKQKANSDKWSRLASVKGRLNAEYLDNLKPNEFAKYKITAVTFNGVESEPSEVTQAVSKILPPQVTNLIASTNVPKKIILSWDAPAYDDFDHFNIYSARSKFLPFFKIAETTKNTYEDVLESDGAIRQYYVTMVDKDGLESPRSDVNITGMSLDKPKSPSITGYKLISEGQIEINWYAQDNRAKSYAIFKNGEQVATSVVSNYQDNAYAPGDKYQIIAIDEFGIASEPSSKLSVGE